MYSKINFTDILIFSLLIIFVLLSFQYTKIVENMVNPKLYVRHLEISPNSDPTRLSPNEQRKIMAFRKCQGKRRGFYRCINSIYLPQTIEKQRRKSKDINYSSTGNIRHLFPVKFD